MMVNGATNLIGDLFKNASFFISEKYFVKCQRKGITLLNMTVGYLLAPGYPDWDSDVYTCRFMSSLNASIKMTYYDSVRRDKNCSCRNEYGQNTSKEIVMERDDYCGGFLIAYGMFSFYQISIKLYFKMMLK